MTEALVIPFYAPKAAPVPEAACSFCGTLESRVRKLFSNAQDGEAARWLCDRCVAKSTRLMQ